MSRWTKGEDEVDRLLTAGELQKVLADNDTAVRLLASARRHVESATTTADTDPEGALSLAYDAARKAATALLAHQGLRPTAAGGHVVVVAAMREQFGDLPGLKSIDRIRRRRHESEYPDPNSYASVEADEVTDAIQVANDCINTAETLLGTDQLGIY